MNDNRIQLAREGIQNKLNEYDALKVEMAKFLVIVDKTLSEKQAKFSQEAHIHRQQTIEQKSTNEELRRQLDALSPKESSVQQKANAVMKKLKENEAVVYKDCQETIELREKRSQINAQIEKLNEEKERVQVELESSFDAYDQRMQSHLNSALVYGLFSGMRIEPVNDDQIKLSFFNLDPNNLERNFSVVMNLGGEDYQIEETSPQLPRDFLENAQKELNQHRRLSRFLQQVWSQFDSLVSQ
ncbi:hypothetical protein CORT_0D06210 [Candida orthopsilosis Co 90-125]|uniref:Kinetochore protein SPC25 n=1 Tax=Candida orthopsilosis (strain 90-125) TaxID=1136231 RepID=H8X5K1_CANO9|nr:hypothetical protein CORT_0D06210 [Candida orthopsilosis Co 90-125]CCG23458.1 hypothetical protein CORT_0D06210 [Candida orthopsilosis Co 90-125]